MPARKQQIQRRLPKTFRILYARPKLIISVALAVAVALLLPAEWRPITRALIGWNAGVVLYLCIVYWMIARSEVSHIRRHAAQEDEGRVAILALTVAATLASLAAIVVLLGLGDGKNAPPQLAFAIATILLSWGFIHSIFALHYAYEFYTESPPASGLKFPGDTKPDYLDFVYFSFVVGMTFQVSDVAIVSRKIRRTVTAHAVVAFLFNVALLAIMINIAASAISK
ncbi:MAG TPA: DUF1345 domain-containing protein [Xanthobacteraceae bacterium]|nr:DUF1345 domain-containing protein [Xanthobacteraceae bacterium]